MDFEKIPQQEDPYVLRKYVNIFINNPDRMERVFLKTWEKNKEVRGVCPPAKGFILAMIKEEFGVSFTKEDYYRYVSEDLRHEIFSKVLKLTGKKVNKLATTNSIAEPAETHYSEYEESLRAKTEKKTHRWGSIEDSLPRGDR